MRFIVNSQVLQKNLQAVSGVIVSTNTLPIISNFLFEIGNESINIVATDLETTMVATIELTEPASEEGRIAIPSKMLSDIIKTFGDIPLVFNIDLSSFAIEISAGDGKYKLNGLDPEAFPEIPAKEDNLNKADFQSDVLVNAISKTLFAVGTDPIRPAMCGVYVELGAEACTFVATDAHKLVKYKRSDAHSENGDSVVLPKKPLSLIKNALAGRKEVVSVAVEYNQKNAFFTFDNFMLSSILVEGRYPNFEAVIPKNNDKKLVVERSAFLASLKRTALFASQSVPTVRLKMDGKELVISAEDIDFANEAKERMLCNYTGEGMEIGFNSKFMIEMLQNIDTDEVCIEMSHPSRAGIILPVNNEDANEEILMLVMPVMLNQ